MDIESRLRSIVALFAFLVSLAPGIALAGITDPFYSTGFGSQQEISDAWIIASGNWQVVDQSAGGRFSSTGTNAASIAFVAEYKTRNRDDTWPNIGETCFVEAVIQLQGTASNARAGVVFSFSDAGNFNEVTFFKTGVAQLRRTEGGVFATVASAPFTSPGLGKWMHVSVGRTNERTTVKVDGVVVFDNVPQAGFPGATFQRAGLIARNGPALFDSFDADSLGTKLPVIEDFNDGGSMLGASPGSWALQSNMWVNTEAESTAISSSPLQDLWFDPQALDIPYTIKVRMLNQFGGAGNRVGLVWMGLDGHPGNYEEVVFSPTGQASINDVRNGVRTLVASAPYAGGGKNQWFEIEVAYDSGISESRGHINVNGVTVFDRPISLFTGNPGLITHWTQAKFDDFRAVIGVFQAFSDFPDTRTPNGPLGSFFNDNLDWTLQNGAVRNEVVAKTSRALLKAGSTLNDIDYRARMVNHYRSAGNLVGFAYGISGKIDQYYEVVFSPTGVAQLNRALAGVTTRVATASYAGGGAHQWFDVRLTQRNQRTTVEVNGVPVFQDVFQPDAVEGALGFITHWASAEFDEVSLQELPPQQ